MAIENEPSQLSLRKKAMRTFLEIVFVVCFVVCVTMLFTIGWFIVLLLIGILNLGTTNFLVGLGEFSLLFVSSWFIGYFADKALHKNSA